ncbi:rRNA adenine N-6-methyltransferase family protein [Saccharopolyspora cebuensis]|uniref:rRNA adenine N-6-methyltransferase family protein n=1 Tax=Saccharopolyspora cebuensis TaxID=418759 RepID=A0ABV4CLP0_9PSEU
MDDNELASLADPSFEQYFLVSPEKLALIYDAAGIRPSDRVVEIGAGVGTVARTMPPCQSLTVVEFDRNLIDHLRRNVPHANVIHGDGLRAARDMAFDVLVSNLPNLVTESLIDILPELSFRVAVMAVGEHADLGRLPAEFKVTEVATISGTDFRPAQPSVSRIVKVAR